MHYFQHMIKTGQKHIVTTLGNTKLLFGLEPNYSLE